ncbi:MAG: glycoside hydrolase family 20 zincin-like fold domain-containing protein [Bacteroidota bacterium]
MRYFFIICLITSLLSAKNHAILPIPQSLTEKNASYKITSSTKIVLGSDNPLEQFIAEQLNDEFSILKETRLKIVGESSVRKLTANYIFIGKPTTKYGKKFLSDRKGKLTPEMKAEGYFLDVDADGIVIIAESEKGMFYGVMSLLQLLRLEKRSVIVDGVSIHDFPSQKMRGITDDISRGQVSTLDNLKKIVRFCARYKMNIYCPYIEDVFQFKKHPAIGKNRGALSATECKELDAYAKKYFVEVIPIFETLGHWENILILPDYAKYAEFPGAQTVNVSDEKVYSLLDEMIGEIAACFSSPYFNIAADESWDVGLGVNKERVKKSDLATVHAEHYKRTFDIVKKHGKKVMMYGDIILDHPEILKKIPQDVTMVDWHYGTSFDYPSPEIFKNAGFPYVVSPAVWNFTGPFPNYLNTFLNIQNLSLDGYQNGSQGILCSNWNDFGGEALRELNYFGYAWNAECAWNPLHADQESFQQRFFADFFGTQETNNIRTVYLLLTNPANQYHWYELWRHPMLQNRDDMIWEKRLPLMQRMQSINSTMPFALELIESASKTVTKNSDHLQYLSFVAKLNLWFAEKIEAQEKIKLLLKDTVKTKSEIAMQISTMSKKIVEELMKVKTEFERVWHTTNKTESIQLLLNRYDRQAAYWSELTDQLAHEEYVVDPIIKSQWIYHPNAKDSTQIPKAYFRKSFSVEKGVKTAAIQLLGDSWVKLSVNGKAVGEVSARRSLSLMVENQRAKIFDIALLLNDSVNVISVEAQNFQENGSAGVNVYGEIISVAGAKQIIATDNSWMVSDTTSTDWSTIQFNTKAWPQAVPKKYPLPVVAPNLSTGRTSWFER